MDTRQKIKETALGLFSQRGFEAVSIRDICGEVGIKESTVYYYFKNKQSIFDEFLTDFEAITLKIQSDFNCEFAKTAKIEEQSFVTVGLAFLTQYLLNERILKLLRMLMIEQHVNKGAAALLRRVLFENPLRQDEMIFEQMRVSGLLREQDVKTLAVEYYAPIFFVFQRYFSSGDVTEESREEADLLVTAHLANFYRRYFVERKEG